MNAKIVTFGEVMLRLAPPGNERLIQTTALELQVGGSEANVAVSLANFGHPVQHVTKLPSNPLGERVLLALRTYGVDTRAICRGGTRLGLYFIEKGCSQRPSVVLYDRQGSAFASSGSNDYDWENILEGAVWFHVSGITPALSKICATHALDACRTAHRKGIPTSLDLNYRKTLWPVEQARKILTDLASYCDLLIANEEDTEEIFCIQAAGARIGEGIIPYVAYGEVAQEIASKFGARWVALTLRASHGATINGWTGLLFDASQSELVMSRSYEIHIVDRVGAGDAFVAGLLHGIMKKWDPRACVEFAAAAGCLKHTILGDFNLSTECEVLALVDGQSSGRVLR